MEVITYGEKKVIYGNFFYGGKCVMDYLNNIILKTASIYAAIEVYLFWHWKGFFS